VKLTFTKHWP